MPSRRPFGKPFSKWNSNFQRITQGYHKVKLTIFSQFGYCKARWSLGKSTRRGTLILGWPKSSTALASLYSKRDLFTNWWPLTIAGSTQSQSRSWLPSSRREKMGVNSNLRCSWTASFKSSWKRRKMRSWTYLTETSKRASLNALKTLQNRKIRRQMRFIWESQHTMGQPIRQGSTWKQ